ncbi:MerR family transcriptional regulator [Photobacterium sp. BZF1]|uniref:MerR family transcriptional regulator n=1 Tax=Photobacterium sp. BZF1 TaxID=1904457 RepID=UPI001653432A|nr:MerR family transcriptional regulator [Photobacterium sp. BZF1]MBC7003084.1 MerR family transcriptional regulator [Photobacterium sp. BZF1]
MKLYRIGQISKLYDISVDTLRHYEKIGILQPEVIKDNGYRYYSNRQVWQLNVIRDLRFLGIGLNDIADYLIERSIDKSIAFIDLQLETIFKKEQELERVRSEILARKTALKAATSHSSDMHITEQYIAERKAWLRTKKVHSFWDIDRVHREIESEVNCKQNSTVNLGLYGARICHKDFLAGNYSTYNDCFILNEQGDHTLPAGEYACLSFWGHNDMGKIQYHYDRIKQYLRTHNLTMTGPAIEIYLIDIHETDNPEEFLTELQVPFAK